MARRAARPVEIILTNNIWQQQLHWSNEDLETLQSYRNAYRLETPSAFKSPISAAILTAPGIGRYSPTMARKREKRKIPKDQLALAVRKHFNSVAVNETEVITDFVYAAKNQGELPPWTKAQMFMANQLTKSCRSELQATIRSLETKA